MSEIKHTPGPWVHCLGPQADVRAGDEWTGRKIANTMFAELKGPSADQHRIYEDRVEECRANARLIAAAPDLLEAAKETISSLENEFGGMRARVNFPALYAAIAKAGGRHDL